MPNLVLVMIGGAIGAGLRFEVGRLSLRLLGPNLPWGTLIVNLSGGLLMGILAGTLVRHQPQAPLFLLLGVGVLGGYTTFSAFSLETFNMLHRGAFGVAAGYALVSVVGSVVMLFAGLWLTRLAA
jgi:CrcB protein